MKVVGWLRGCVLMGAVAGHASAQVEVERPAGAARGRDPQQGVYVRDSAIAADKFELGKRMERLKEWHKSADVYQEIVEKYKDPVIPTKSNARGQIVRYSSVTDAVRERLAKWPEEGLAVYRGRYEAAAAAKLQMARRDDYAALSEVLHLYFVTDAAKTAGIRLMDLYLESGEFAAAAMRGDELLRLHPGLGADVPLVLFRTALAYHLAGNKEQAAARLEELAQKHADAAGIVAGKDARLVDVLTEKLKEPAAVASGEASDSWETFAPPRVSQAKGDPGAKAYAVSLSAPSMAGLSENQRQAATSALEEAREQGKTITVFPAVDGDELFFQDGLRVYALHLESGVPLPGWAQTYAGSRQGQFVLPVQTSGINWNDPWHQAMFSMPRQHTLTVTETSLLAVMGLADPRPNMVQVDSGTRLVCLERGTGKMRWIVSPKEAPSNPAEAKSLNFSGTPLVAGENVYVIARGNSGAGVEDCHVFCYDVANGAFKWSSYVASAQTGGMSFNAGTPMIVGGETLSHLSFASGRVFVLTNLGAVGALDAYTGATAWLSIYQRNETEAVAWQRRNAFGGWNGGGLSVQREESLKPWEFSPVLCQDGRVYVLPTDGTDLLVYDAATGEEIKRLPREFEFGFGKVARRFKLDMLLAVLGDKLVVSGGNSVFVLNWPIVEVEKGTDERLTRESVWYKQDAGIVMGRPFVTAERIYLPTDRGLRVLDMKLQRTIRSYPGDNDEWPEGEGGGNVVVMANHVVVAGARNVTVYTDLAGVRQRFEAALKAEPGNIEARLIFAELMFNAKQYPEAKTVLDEAVAMIASAGPRGEALRSRVFSDAVMFAQKAGADKTEAGVAMARELFERARLTANTPMQQVNYRLSYARFIESLKEVQEKPDYAVALRLYQEVLSSPPLRRVMLTAEETAQSQPAGDVAEAAITELIRKAGAEGPVLYAPVEQEAREKLAALDGQDADALMALAETYPNSAKVAAAAMMRAAEAHEKNDRPRMATQVLRRLYARYAARHDPAERARISEAMARNYLRAGSIESAYGRLSRTASVQPEVKLSAALILPDGTPLASEGGGAPGTVKEAAAALEKVLIERAERNVPDVRLPTYRTRTVEERLKGIPAAPPEPFVAAGGGGEVGNVQAILEPASDLLPSSRHDRLLVWSGGRLACIAPGSAEPQWRTDALSEGASGIAWLKDRLLAWGEGDVALLDAEKGTVVWKVDVRSLPSAELVSPSGGGEVAANERVVRPNDVMLQQQRAFALGLRARGGPGGVFQPVVPQADPPPADGRERVLVMRAAGDRLIGSTSAGRVFAIDLVGGKLLWQVRLSSGGAIQQTLVNDDFAAVRTVEGNTVQLVALDAQNGLIVYRKVFPASASNWPINCVLAPDGMLIWTSRSTIAAKDLYEPGEAVTWEKQDRSFEEMIHPDQLLVFGQRIFALGNRGSMIYVLSLRSGEAQGEGWSVGSPSETRNARLRISGARLYAIGADSLVAYQLSGGASTAATDPQTNHLMPPEAIVAKDFLVVPGVLRAEGGAPPAAAGAPEQAYAIQMYSRLQIQDAETKEITDSMRLMYYLEIKEPAGIRSWAAVEGGVYYLTGAEKLVFLKGARQ